MDIKQMLEDAISEKIEEEMQGIDVDEMVEDAIEEVIKSLFQ